MKKWYNRTSKKKEKEKKKGGCEFENMVYNSSFSYTFLINLFIVRLKTIYIYFCLADEGVRKIVDQVRSALLRGSRRIVIRLRIGDWHQLQSPSNLSTLYEPRLTISNTFQPISIYPYKYIYIYRKFRQKSSYPENPDPLRKMIKLQNNQASVFFLSILNGKFKFLFS